MGIVDAITDDEDVGHRETNEIKVNCHLAMARLVNKRTGEDARHFLLAKQVARVNHRAPCIHDVVNEKHGAASKVELELAD